MMQDNVIQSTGTKKRIEIAWLVKVIVFGVLLAGAGAFFGLALKWAGDGYVHLVPGTWGRWEAIQLGLCVMGSFAAVAVAAGFVAVLIRPFWVAALSFLVSSLSLFLTFEISLLSFVIALIYFVMGLIYLAGVRTEIAHRIKFSIWQIRSSQTVFLVILVALACTSLYFGYAKKIDAEGYKLNDKAINGIVSFTRDHVIDKVFPEEDINKSQILEDLRNYLDNDLRDDMVSYQGYVPMGLAAIAFSILMLATFILSWFPLLILSLIFFLLLRLKLVKRKAHPVEVTRLSIQ
jgi:ABC-type multidrug transport system fused ATPase/permease subunit